MSITQSGIGIFAVLIPIGIALVNVICAIGIWADADKRNENGKPVHLVWGWIWTVLGLICGLPALALYWAVHYAAISSREQA